jgi:hypothetical protein
MMKMGETLRQGRAYGPLGLAAIVAAATAFSLGIGGRRLIELAGPDRAFAYAALTGAALVLSLGWQWRLYLARRTGDGRRIRTEYALHRWSGSAPALLLLLHVGGPSASLLSIVACLLLVSSAAGLFHQKIVALGGKRLRTLWLAVHVGSAALMIPLVAVHLWATLAFRP